ncbi:MAG: FAD-binding oxidoreductase [Woeseia sp.]
MFGSVKPPAYPDYQRPCGWNALLPPRQPTQSLTSDVACDVVIVGAGYTGLAAARRFAERAPQSHIVVLDSSEVGEGNPGRNSGFMLDIALANDARAGEVERMKACNRLLAGTMQDIKNLVAEHGIACELAKSGTWRAAAGSAGVAALRRYRDFLEATGLEFEMLGRPALRNRLGTNYYREALYSPDCHLVQPAALIRGMAGHLPPAVTLRENSPAVGIERDGGSWRVLTPQASVVAPDVILANNAFSRQLGPGRSRMAAVYTFAALTESCPDSVPDTGDQAGWGLLPAHRLGSSLRRSTDGRFLIRSLYAYEKEPDNGQMAEKLRRSLQRRYPQLAAIPFASVWSGATGFTLNGAPLWGRVAPGLFVSAGCNGGGIVKGTLFGSRLADLVLGTESPEIPALFGTASWMPPDPLRSLGFRLTSGLQRYRGRAEM